MKKAKLIAIIASLTVASAEAAVAMAYREHINLTMGSLFAALFIVAPVCEVLKDRFFRRYNAKNFK